MKKTSLTKGFTLIELMVVIAIIGVLASIVMVSLATARAKGRDARRVSDMKNIQLALEQYYNDNLKYPSTLGTLAPNYINNIPTDPSGSSYKNSGNYYYVAANAAGSTNCTSNPASMYHMAAVLEVSGSLGSGTYAQAAGRYNSWQGAICGGTGSDFNGASTDCTTTYNASNANTNAAAGTATTCYDVTN